MVDIKEDANSRNPKKRVYRIGIICPSPSIQLSSQYDALADLHDFEFYLLFRRRQQCNPAWKPAPPKRTDYEFLPQPKLPWPSSVRYRLNANITSVLQRHNFDAMILCGIYDSSAIWQAIWWCRRNNKPYLLRCDANVMKEKGWFRRVIRKLLISKNISDAAGLLCIGTQNIRFYELYGGREEQFFLAPWEIDYEDLENYFAQAIRKRSEHRSELGINENDCAVVTVSRLLSWKGYDLLVPVMGKLAKKGLPIKLIIVGEGPYRPVIEKMVSDYEAPAHLCGNLDRRGVINSMAASDIFALASYKEPWGLVVNEAALCGLPLVLSSAAGAAADLLVQGKNGYVFEAGNQDSLYKYLLKLIENEALRKEMGQKSKAIITKWRQQNSAVTGYEKALKHALGISR